MTDSPRAQNGYWVFFGAICLCVLAVVFGVGVVDRAVLATLIETGGVVESLPVVVLAVAAVLSAVVALRARRRVRWALFALLCLFLAGEEAAWGAESVLGWTALPGRAEAAAEAGAPDLHNMVSSGIKAQLFGSSDPDVSGGLRWAVYGAIVISAGGFLLTSVALGILGRDRILGEGRLARLHITDPSLQFVITGIGLLVFANVDFFQGIGMEYMPGIWPLEETYEVLGSVAFLFAALAAWGRAGRGVA